MAVLIFLRILLIAAILTSFSNIVSSKSASHSITIRASADDASVTDPRLAVKAPFSIIAPVNIATSNAIDADATTVSADGVAGTTVQTPCSCDGPIMDCSSRGKVTLSRQEICPEAKILNLRNNSLSMFPDTLKVFAKLNLSGNKLKTLPPAALLNPSISALEVSGNEISGSPDQIRSLSNLELLDVSLNRLTSLRFVPKPCNLQVLEASVNSIPSLEGIQKCSRLVSLYVARNNISTLSAKVFSKMFNLQELGVYGNPLTHIAPDTFIGLKNLIYLYMSDTKLSKISDGVFLHMSSLRRLYLSVNPNLILTSNIFNGLSQLTHLHLRGANIDELPTDIFSELRSLEVLNLSKNRLQSIPDTAFIELSSLTDLDLSDNLFSKLPQGVFRGLVRLRTLHLEDNKLREVQDSLLADATDLEIIELSSNLFTQLPKLRNCCDKVTALSLRNNSIISVSHTQLRSLLRRQMSLDLRSNHVTVEELFWAWDIPGVLPFVARNNCQCGGLHLGNGTVQMCFDISCGSESGFSDWVSAAKATVEDS